MVLECYRVLLLQRPPTLAIFSETFNEIKTKSVINTKSWFDDLAAMMTVGGSSDNRDRGLVDLAAIGSLAWFPSPHDSLCYRESPLWKPEFVEIALNRWTEAQTEIQPSVALLSHMAQISLHCNVGYLQRLARPVARIGRMSSHHPVLDSIAKWLSSRHFAISKWHAESIVKLAKVHGSRQGRKQRTSSPPPSVTTKGQACFSETPHLPFCIYYATLILWYGNLLGAQDQFLRDVCLEEGARMLLQLKVRVAQHLGNALYELQSEED